MFGIIQWASVTIMGVMGAGGVAIVWPTRRKQLRYQSAIMYSDDKTTIKEEK